MRVVDEQPMETIHLYVVREEEKRPYPLLPLFCAFLCLLAIVALTWYSGEHPLYEHETLHIPALLLPLKIFTVSVKVIPTGVRTFPATNATGTLTITYESDRRADARNASAGRGGVRCTFQAISREVRAETGG